ncbi:MAG: 3-oxoacyl-[acyl-carrier-protein] reductase FabG [Alphaproteobacteria bacterium MarineAlpha9_Bin2]|nr:MAG: 3-oxoacyl-[acyl-carrier-protein] reductase FabG [Alphaproteobacteria bacterium MarineAlpha9_Bin2]PPR29354.1 MAG: 3-oxoacyl-[acyl-carrier-protein] reductase FabG [Alphaproteobacteria bacterium MarineAlpha9_Bin1]
MFDYSNKIALVTGASGDIGAAIAVSLAKQSAKVAITGTRSNILEKMCSEYPKAFTSIVCDLSKSKNVDMLVPEVEDKVGPIDILINNAGITDDQLAIRMNKDMWNSVMEVNLFAAFNLSKSVIKGMMKRRYGRIIQITSIVGHIGNPGQVNYAASKAGLVGMSKSLALEVASRNITSNCIAPGFIKTSMTEGLNESQKEKLIEKIPSKKLGLPQDVASACVFLASEEAAYINGSTIHVNGGLAMI